MELHVMRVSWRVFAIAVLLPFAVPALGSAQNDSSRKTLKDINHPKSWVRVQEYAKDQQLYTHLEPAFDASARVASPDYTETVDAEVDAYSRILIQFSRDSMLDYRDDVEVALLVTAFVRGEKEVRRIEVPGYSLVGERTEQATARIRSTREFLRLIQTVGGEFRPLGDSARFSGRLSTESRVLRDEILDNEPRLRALLTILADTAWRDVTEGIAYIARASETLLTSDAQRALVALDSLKTLPSDADQARTSRLMRHVSKALGFLSRLGEIRDAAVFDELSASLARFFLKSLKDTDISVPLSGAKPGEDIVITFANFAEDKRRQRSLTIRLRVRSFGWREHVSDASLLAKRLKVSRGAFDRGLALARSVADTATTPTARVLQDPVQFVPAPGVTLGWSYLDRGLSRKGKIVRFLEPGVGITVLFPKFSETTARFTAATADAKVTEEHARVDKLDVGVGFTLSLWGNKVVGTFGRNLTSSRPRNYWGVGFSFARIASTLAGGEEK